MTRSQPPYCTSGPLWNTRHSRPVCCMRTLVSRPGIDAYCGFSLVMSHEAGGLFHPGTAVEPFAVETSCEGCMPRAGLTGTLPVGAVVGGAEVAAGACAAAANGSASAAPRIIAPKRRASACSMDPPLLIGFVDVAGADVLVLALRARGERLLVLVLVALEEVSRVRLRILLAGVGLGRVLGNLVTCGERHRRHGHHRERAPHALPPGWSASLPLPW